MGRVGMENRGRRNRLKDDVDEYDHVQAYHIRQVLPSQAER